MSNRAAAGRCESAETAGAYLGHERAQARALERLPPLEQLVEGPVPYVQLDDQLADGQRREGGDERREGVKLKGLGVDLEDVDVCVVWNDSRRLRGERERNRGGNAYRSSA